MLWISMPCTGGSSWQWVNRYIARSRKRPEMMTKLESHRALKNKLMQSLKTLLKETICCKPIIAIEWPLRCTYWRDDDVVDIVRRHHLKPYRVDGCMVGLTVRFQPQSLGRPLQKPWLIMTNTPSLGEHLRILCDGSHMHGRCSGKDAKVSENYTTVFAERVHLGLKAAVAIQ